MRSLRNREFNFQMAKIKTVWDFKLLYKSDTDPQIEKDLKAIEKAFISFEKKYKGKNFISQVVKLKKALKDYERLEEVVNGFKPYWYFARRKDVQSDNALVAAKLSQYEQRIAVATNRTAFFRIELAKIKPKTQKVFLNNPLLTHYRYLLKVIFDESQYLLSEKEEQLANLLSQPAYSMWVNGQKKYQNGQTIRFKGKDLPLAEAVGMIPTLPKKDRRFLQVELNAVFKRISHFAEAEINAIYNLKKIMDERRGYPKPYSATVVNYENEEKTVEGLVEVVTKNLKISQRFYRLHAKLLGEKKITRAERAVPIGEIKRKFDFPETIAVVKEAFGKFGPRYPKLLEAYAENGQFDVFPKKGKVGGAYKSTAGRNPILILLNHEGSIRSVETLAHEMGHAYHSELTREKQSAIYQGYSTSTAEVASTFFEQLAMEELENKLDVKDRIILLHNKIKGDVNTIFVQIAFFNFELELHNRIRAEGQVAKEEIAKLMNKHFASCFGDAVELSEGDGYFFVYLSHIRRYFYVYSYAFGQLVSKALFEKWKEDKSYAKKIEQFLSAGGSDTPENIFKSIGIDVRDPQFFQTGLKAIEKDIAKLEKLAVHKR